MKKIFMKMALESLKETFTPKFKSPSAPFQKHKYRRPIAYSGDLAIEAGVSQGTDIPWPPFISHTVSLIARVKNKPKTLPCFEQGGCFPCWFGGYLFPEHPSPGVSPPPRCMQACPKSGPSALLVILDLLTVWVILLMAQQNS